MGQESVDDQVDRRRDHDAESVPCGNGAREEPEVVPQFLGPWGIATVATVAAVVTDDPEIAENMVEVATFA